MKPSWLPEETGKHQDHVIAHVVGTTVLGYFTADDAIHLLLDIGFIWTIYIDGEMGLLPQSVMIAELPGDGETKAELLADIEMLHDKGRAIPEESLMRLTPAPVDCLIREVSLYVLDRQRWILIEGEEADLSLVASLVTGEISVHTVSSGG